MQWFQAPDYWLARLVIERGLAIVYLVAFLVAANQFRPLCGERGLLPAPRFLQGARLRDSPSIFHLHYSDRLFTVLAWVGIALAAVSVAGLPESGPIWLSMVAWFVLWAIYLSIVSVGQTFYGFGWEILLLEAGFLAIFLGTSAVSPPTVVIVAFRWLLFRLEFGAGLIKARGDRCWRDLTCLHYHHETQPMPNPLSWFFHHLPSPLHKVEVAANHFAQLAAPLAIFAPQPIASLAGAVIVVTQCWLVLSGNFSWLNLLTIVLAFSAFSNATLGQVLHVTPPSPAGPPLWYEAVVIALAALILALSYRPARNLVSSHQRMNSSFDPLRLVNTYGAFGSVTKVRYEVAIEGTEEAQPGTATVWQEYQFKAKPGNPRRRPPQVAPYHLRLDWLMWFIALPGWFDDRWLVPFVGKLLEGDRPTLKLLKANPFPGRPPASIRARVYRYRFSTRQERKATGAWWVRTLVGEYLPAMSLSPGQRTAPGPSSSAEASPSGRQLPT